MQWARANGYPWDEGTCLAAAGYGQLEVLQWARANGCPWDEHTCRAAVATGIWKGFSGRAPMAALVDSAAPLTMFAHINRPHTNTRTSQNMPIGWTPSFHA
jgi:hypothetical protein